MDFTILVRFLIGLAFGFALVRGSIGFAGSVNRLYRTKSSKLAQTILYIFILTAIFTAFIISGEESTYKLSIYPINLGLILGGLMFGFGMAMSSCCATGSLTDLASGFSRAFVTIVFFSMGVFLGFSTQKESLFVTDSYLSSVTGEQFQGGVFLPDLFKYDGFNGYLGAILLTIVFSLALLYLAQKYEEKFHTNENVSELNPHKNSLLEKIFVKNWNMPVSILFISSVFAFLLTYSHKGWGASSALGIWFGKFVMLFGIEAESLSAFSTKKASLFSESLLTHAGSMQNIGIIFGAIVALTLAGVFKKSFIAGLKITPKGVVTFAFGGFIMGFGTRLSNGCNVGALYTPIAEFSLSGWIYLIFIVAGGFLGNMFVRRFISPTCSVV
ncbi:YeeE/YedE family protein [Sulfurimonas sp. SAG-AH-194-C21]|nr:YeeE/YedE family protein [Sulfurimonas sp. SAG-AH-194-C21]MDF1883369.1 YeeE/YedE family protein [Sulfurimonas sp. SAG-AH-194-C21]